MVDLILKNGIAYIDGSFIKANVIVSNEKIVSITTNDMFPDATKIIDLKGQYVLPGTIDTHVHVRDPGHIERGDFYTETLAAAAGGVTTIMEHPISIPPQYNVEILENRIKRAAMLSNVDFCFYGAAGGEHPEEITKLAKDGRIVAFKSFLHAAPEGREKEFKGLTMANDYQLLMGMKELAKTGLICAFHSENNDIIQNNIKKFRDEGKTSPIYHALSRPPFTEYQSVQRVLEFARETGARVEIAHISTPQAMEIVKEAKREGIQVYAETCPHYLFLTEDDLIKYGPFAKCNPPLRSKELSDELWNYVNDGTVDYIGSDHSPFLFSEKTKGNEDIFAAVSGFPGIDLRLPLMIDAFIQKKIALERVVELLAVNPAKIFNIYPQKGAIRVGSDADFVVVDLHDTTVVDKEKNYSHAKNIAIPYDGKKLHCKLNYTILRGEVVMENGIVGKGHKGFGKLVIPNTAK